MRPRVVRSRSTRLVFAASAPWKMRWFVSTQPVFAVVRLRPKRRYCSSTRLTSKLVDLAKCLGEGMSRNSSERKFAAVFFCLRSCATNFVRLVAHSRAERWSVQRLRRKPLTESELAVTAGEGTRAELALQLQRKYANGRRCQSPRLHG